MSVARAQQEISSKEFSEWVAYNKIDPFGQDRNDLGAAIISATVCNVNRSKGSRPYKPADFMPDFGNQKRAEQTCEQQIAMLKNFAKKHNRKLNKHG